MPSNFTALRRLERLERIGKLYLRPDEAQEADYSAYFDRPEAFIREELKDELLWEKPLEMIESVRVNRKTSARGANSVGKDHTAAELALWWVFAKKGLVIITGPTRGQVFEILFGRELRTLVAKANLPIDVQRFLARPDETLPTDDATTEPDKATFKRGILGLVSTDTSKLTGHHAPHVLCIITEAQGVRDIAFNAMYSNATGPDDRILIVGNPEKPGGNFYESHRPNSGWHPIVITAHEHPNVVQGRTVIEGGPSREWIEDMRAIHGESSPWWRTYIEAEFPTTSVDVLFPDRDLDKAVAAHAVMSPVIPSRAPSVIGIDVAKGGGDACAMARLQKPLVREVVRFETNGIIETEEKIVKQLMAWRIAPVQPAPKDEEREISWLSGKPTLKGLDCLVPGTLVVDSAPTGGGPGIIAHLISDYGYAVEPFNGSSRPPNFGDEKERYENLRAYGYWALHITAMAGEVGLPNDALLLQSLRATTYLFNKQDGVQITRKPEIRKVLKRSPDDADAVMMAWAQSAIGSGEGAADPNTDYGI